MQASRQSIEKSSDLARGQAMEAPASVPWQSRLSFTEAKQSRGRPALSPWENAPSGLALERLKRPLPETLRALINAGGLKSPYLMTLVSIFCNR